MSDLVWYAGYGSNLSPERFAHYLGGGRPGGATRTYPGARDRAAAREVRPLEVPGSVAFAWESPTWGGGIAFYAPPADGDSSGRALLTGYLVTREQLADVVEQEMWRPPGAETDLSDLLGGRLERLELGPGRYETLLVVARIEGRPVLTCTCPDPEALGLRAPAAAYLLTMVRGLHAVHGLDDEAIVGYLSARPGIGRDWTEPRLRGLLRDAW